MSGNGNEVVGSSKNSTPQHGTLDVAITLTVRDVPLAQALRHVTEKTGVEFEYGEGVLPTNKRVTLNAKNMAAEQVVLRMLEGSGVTLGKRMRGHVALIRSSSQNQKTGSIVGRVADSSGKKGLVGATITVVGTNLSVMTGDNGMYAFPNVPVGQQTISARMLGFQARSVSTTVDSGKVATVVITLQQTSTTLSEIVTTVTGGQRRVEVANDIAKIDVDELRKTAPVRSVSDMLSAARIPGVEVTTSSGLPGAPKRIRLRGVGSMSQSNDPVVIVDGVWISAATSTSSVINQTKIMSAGGLDPSLLANSYTPSRLDDIDPATIESIEILRGPSAASLYGTDAANGVIVITTKRGQAGVTRWNLEVNHDWNSIPGQYQPVYRGWGKSFLTGDIPQSCNLFSVQELQCRQDSVSITNPRNLPLASNEASGHHTGYRAGVSGGTQSVQYSLNASVQDELGATKLPDVERIRLRKVNEPTPGWLERPDGLKQVALSTQLTMQPRSDLDVALLLSTTQTDSRSAGLAFSTTSSLAPIDTISFIRPSGVLTRERGSSKSTSGFISANVDWRPFSWLLPKFVVGAQRITRADASTTTTRRCVEGGCELPEARPSIYRGEQSIYTARATTAIPLNMRRFERFLSIKPSLGLEVKRNLSEGVHTRGDNLALGSEDLQTAGSITSFTQVDNSATAGWFVNVNLGIWNRFYTDLGFRRDIGSALSQQISTPTYPKLGTSWAISEEPFFPKLRFLDMLRLRVSYGHSAVQPDPSAIHGRYTTTQVVVNGQLVEGIRFEQYGNVRLKPERAIELEYGFDAFLFNNRTELFVTIANRTNRNQLIQRSLPLSSGVVFPTFMENIAQVNNKSVEITLNSRVLERNGIVWSVDGSMATQINRVQKLGNTVTLFNNSEARIVEGFPLFGVWARPVAAYNDVNGDGILVPSEVVIGDSLAYIGWNHPKYSMQYGSLLSLMNGRLNFTASLTYDSKLTQYQMVYDGWGAEDPNAPISEQAKALLINYYANVLGERIGNRQTISVLRFNTASASVTLPDAWARQFRATSAILSLQGSNLGLWTNYRGRDPGVNSTPVGESSRDNGMTLPMARKYAFLLRLTF